MAPPGTPLSEVKAAQARARAVRWSIGKIVLGTIFLLGALSYPLGPDPRSSQTALWMALLLLLSTVYLGLGLRGIAQARGRGRRLWLALTLAWGVLATVLLRLLSHRPT